MASAGRTLGPQAPSHVFGFEPLFRTFPDAIVVQTHRDPLTVLASVASLTLVLQSAFTDHLDLAEIGAEVTQRWSSGLERAMQARRDVRVDERFVDVRYQELLRDPMAIVRRIYDRFGMTLSVEAEARMRQLPRAPSQGQTRRSPVFPERIRARRAGPPPSLQDATASASAWNPRTAGPDAPDHRSFRPIAPRADTR